MSVEHPPTKQGESNHQVSDDGNSSATRSFCMSDEDDSWEKCIIPDQKNLAEEIQELRTKTPARNSNILLNNEKLLDNISEECSAKEELVKPVSEKLA